MEVQVFMLRQDDPAKCTAAKLVKFGLAKQVRHTAQKTIVLDPFAEKTLLKNDKSLANSVTAIDCSWSLRKKHLSKIFSGYQENFHRCLQGIP